MPRNEGTFDQFLDTYRAGELRAELGAALRDMMVEAHTAAGANNDGTTKAVLTLKLSFEVNSEGSVTAAHDTGIKGPVVDQKGDRLRHSTSDGFEAQKDEKPSKSNLRAIDGARASA